MTGFPMHSLTKRPQHLPPPHAKKDKGLVIIAAYKLLQAMLFALIGVGAFHLLHQDIEDVLSTLAEHLHFSSESRTVDFILYKASLLSDPLLVRIGAAGFCYAAIGLAESIGLYLEKAWGEWLTLAMTASFLPLEMLEVFHKVTLVRVSLLVINLLVFLYLLKMVVERGRERSHRAEQA